MQQRDRALIARIQRMGVDDIAEVFRTGNVADNPFLHGEVGEELSHRLRKALDEELHERNNDTWRGAGLDDQASGKGADR